MPGEHRPAPATLHHGAAVLASVRDLTMAEATDVFALVLRAMWDGTQGREDWRAMTVLDAVKRGHRRAVALRMMEDDDATR